MLYLQHVNDFELQKCCTLSTCTSIYPCYDALLKNLLLMDFQLWKMRPTPVRLVSMLHETQETGTTLPPHSHSWRAPQRWRPPAIILLPNALMEMCRQLLVRSTTWGHATVADNPADANRNVTTCNKVGPFIGRGTSSAGVWAG